MSSSLGTVNNACGGTFYDSGGPLANYTDFESSVATFCAPPGQYISFTFTQFNTENFFDDLIIYNGPNTTSPIIGIYSGTNNPGTITSTLGGCITFDFFSDGSVPRPGWTANITCSNTPPSNGNACSSASPFCTGTSYNFPNNTGVPNLGTINCLFSTPNPVWYYFQIQNPGDLLIDISQEDGTGFGLDIDFNLWGPFTSLADGCAQISAGTATSVDCSYSIASSEQANATGVQPGQVYILLLTNFSNLPGFITFAEGPGNTAGTDCDILCAINNLTATPSACEASTNTYTLNGQLSLFNPPSSGTLTVSTSCGGSDVLNAPFSATVDYQILDIIPTGGPCNVTASFSDDPSCSITQSYTSPNPCVNSALNCPQYASVSSSPTTTCGGQVYYLEVENTGCNGTITFNVVGNWGSSFADELTWQVTSNLTGEIVASDLAPGNNIDGGSFNVTVGPLNPSIVGNIFTLTVFDSYLPLGDGFNGTGGFITIQQPLGTNLITPIVGDFGLEASSIFGANIAISPATITINTPTGSVVNSVTNCKDFKVPITLQNNSFCSTTSVSLPWTIVCQSTGAVISSGTTNVTVFPAIPQNLSDVVDIQFNESTCTWSISPQAGCSAASIGTIFNISPNPLSLNPSEACSGGIENFQMQYIGLPGSPNCCVTGGPLETITYTQTFSNPIPSTSPYFSVSNHAALLTIPPNNAGGNAASLNLSISVNNYCFNPPASNTATDYWITILVDGQIVYDQVTINPAPVNNTININLANIAAGYDETSIVQIYVYPNAFQAGGTNTVFNPNLSCPIGPDGRWRADISASIDVTFTEQAPTPASCVYPAAIPYLCCNPVTVSDASATVCQGANIAAALTAWGNAVDAANDNCIVFSRVTPVAGSVPPDNLLPTSSTPGVQILGAYYYCDTDNNGSVNTGDTYTLISTFTATINAPNTAGTASSSPTVCINTPLSSAITIATTGATGIGTPSALPAGVNATWASNSITISGTPTQSGTFNYSIPLTGGCGSVNAIGTITVSDNPSASFTYLGAPFCVNQSGNVAPSLSGTPGGTYTSNPVGLSITPSGVITPSLSSAGTYTITYSLAASGGCPAFTSTNTVVVTALPSTPSLLPNPVCAGNSITLTAGNASYYSFAINGIEVQAPSTDNTYVAPTLAAGDQVCVTAHPPIPFTFNGLISEPQWGNALAKSLGGPTSGFGSGNIVDALYLKNQSGYLIGAVAGRVEDNANNNKILVFLDTKSGGYNNLSLWMNRDGIYFSIKNLDGGIVFDAGFEPDYILGMNYAGATAFFDLYDMQAGSNTFLGTNLSSTLLGYTANSGSGDDTKGFEFALPLASIGNPAGSIKAFVMLVNDPGEFDATTLSNQFLTPAGAADGNYGNGAVNFNFAAPNPVNYSLSAACSTQTCITVSPLPNANVSGDTDICSGESVALNLTSDLTGTTYSWTVNQTNATGAANGTGATINQTITATGASNGTVTYTFTPNSGGCTGNPVNSTITITPLPTLTPIFHE